MLSLEQIKAEVERLASTINAPSQSLPLWGRSDQMGTPHIEADARGYHFVVAERGKEYKRITTQDLDELTQCAGDGMPGRDLLLYRLTVLRNRRWASGTNRKITRRALVRASSCWAFLLSKLAKQLSRSMSILRLVTAVLMKQSEEWETGKVYLTMTERENA